MNTMDRIKELITELNELVGEKPKWENPLIFSECLDGVECRSGEYADKWRTAIHTLKMLHACDGVEPVEDSKEQYSISCSMRNKVDVHSWHAKTEDSIFSSLKKSYWSPCFATEEQAQAAIKRVGEDRIKQMANILSGVWDG